jgi:hypothetical protein
VGGNAGAEEGGNVVGIGDTDGWLLGDTDGELLGQTDVLGATDGEKEDSSSHVRDGTWTSKFGLPFLRQRLHQTGLEIRSTESLVQESE